MNEEGDIAPDSWLRALAVTDCVFWNDPDRAVSSGYYVVEEIKSDSGAVDFSDTVLVLSNLQGSVAEVLACELSPTAP